MYHISGKEFKSLYKHYEYDEGYAMIRVHAWGSYPHLRPCSPQTCLGTRIHNSYQQPRILHHNIHAPQVQGYSMEHLKTMVTPEGT